MPTVLLVYFARPIDEWSKLEIQDKEKFANYTNSREVKFVVAESDLNIFREQIKTADVVYVRGGSSEAVIELFTPLKNELASLLDGKIFVGSSAGVMIMCHNTCSDNNYWRTGLGLIPLNSFVHWNPKLQDQLDTFKKEHNDNNFEWLLIPETEFIIRSY